MGSTCTNSKDIQMPTLVCFYEIDNKEQKNYCLKLKENYKGNRPIKYEIKQIPQIPFAIKLRKDGKIIDIQKIFDNREEIMNETLQKIYDLLNENNNKNNKNNNNINENK